MNLVGRERKKRVLKKMGFWSDLKGPSHLSAQFMALLEEIGIVHIQDRPVAFEDAMNKTSFILPDWMIYAIVLASLLYSAMIMKII